MRQSGIVRLSLRQNHEAMSPPNAGNSKKLGTDSKGPVGPSMLATHCLMAKKSPAAARFPIRMPDHSLMSRKRVDWAPITGGTRFIMTGTLLGAHRRASVFANQCLKAVVSGPAVPDAVRLDEGRLGGLRGANAPCVSCGGDPTRISPVQARISRIGPPRSTRRETGPRAGSSMRVWSRPRRCKMVALRSL